MDHYVSWCLPADELNMDTIWSKYEDFCKPQANEVRARFDLLTGFHQGNKSVDEWYNNVQAQVCLAKYQQETANILHCDIFRFFLKDEDFVSKTINDSSINLDKFPASKVRQLAKKMEASKAMVCHIKQVASDPQEAEINLMRHQWTDLPPSKNKRKAFKSRPSSHKCHISEQQVPPYKRKSILNKFIQAKKSVLSVVIPYMLKDSSVQRRNTSVSLVISIDILPACVSRNKYLSSQEHPNHTSYKLKKCICKMTPYAASQKILSPVMIPFIHK